MSIPYKYSSKENAEHIHGKLVWWYEKPKRLPGLRSHFNHNGRFLGSAGSLLELNIAIAVVYC